MNEEILDEFLSRVSLTILDHNIPKDLVINFDETGLNLTPAGNKSFVTVGEIQIKKVGHGI